MDRSPPAAAQVHLVAGGLYHDIDYARLELLQLLAERPEIRTTVAMDYGDLSRLADCRLLISYTCCVLPTEAETAFLKSWLEGGGRWLALHSTNALLRFREDGLVESPDERPDVMALLGTQFVAHPPIGPYRVRVDEPDHPWVAGEADFEIVDELYLSRAYGPVEPLLSAEFEGEATGFVEGRWPLTRVPILYERRHGAGSVAYYTLGHCRGHYDVPVFTPFWPHPERCAWDYPIHRRILRRLIAWGIEAVGG